MFPASWFRFLSQCLQHTVNIASFNIELCPNLVLSLGNAFRWVQEPNSPTRAAEGENAKLTWDYDLGGVAIASVEWNQILDGNLNEKEIGKIISGDMPQVFDGFKARFNITDKATLIITNVLRTDTGKYECKVTPQSGRSFSSTILLDVQCK